ncbi:hypothetical protein [Streptomyces sp. NPDC046759]|uniref:hypothetical protein n=1 Tax=Streptomyces sp. NPDC046759 TaxID=3155019 RepID=UPI0033E85938
MEGREERKLITSTDLFLSPLLLVVAFPVLLCGVALTPCGVTGMLIAASTNLW